MKKTHKWYIHSNTCFGLSRGYYYHLARLGRTILYCFITQYIKKETSSFSVKYTSAVIFQIISKVE